MLSFKVVTEENKGKIKEELSVALSASEREEMFEIIDGLILDDEDIEYGVALADRCVLLRIFDFGRYFFVYPIEISDDAEPSAAIEKINEYARLEEIELVFIDVPAYALSSFAGFRHMDVDADTSDCETYRVKIKTECDFLTEIPTFDGERVKLNALTEADIPDYARLSKDENVNKYWGYRYSDDVENPNDEYFLENARREFTSHTAISMAIRAEGSFVGEAILYSFDGKGRCDVAVRILPEYQRRGLATEALNAVFEIAKGIGLIRLRAQIKSENTPSVSLFSKIADFVCEKDGISEFEILL